MLTNIPTEILQRIIADVFPEYPFGDPNNDIHWRGKQLSNNSLSNSAVLDTPKIKSEVNKLLWINKKLNQNTRAVLDSSRKDVAQAVFSERLTEIALAYHKKLVTNPKF